ncbi:hypothetical protein EGO58_01010 [Limosilactobacillus reuteri]|uniref:hypothetical protein n=3 Tax=Limosilactobacillus reuteri TaxID=1598 RepID=UPI000F4F47D4|nr:hypothetical protein [Limosilactobacillus reuteri]MDZ5437459.1 hypothetical protein [Limosilactobacillus reuteri]ROV63975.1 hypothetical protein EGO58_00675 [Limosilactobacillus reuteri]ROV64037.1 hypothetical protein EGO58_01010 [Limosilactobacillus reuteri]
MAGLITLPNRDMNGIADLNNNFEYLAGLAKQAMNQANNNGQFNDWSKDGIVTHNGFNLEGDSGYRYWQSPNGWKLVEIIINSKLSVDNFHGGDWFTLPDIVKPNSYQIREPLVGGYYTNQSSPTTISLNPTTGDAVQHGGWIHSLHTMYFSN